MVSSETSRPTESCWADVVVDLISAVFIERKREMGDETLSLIAHIHHNCDS